MADDEIRFSLIPDEEPHDTLERYKKHLESRTSNHFGYPYNLNLASEDLGPFLRYSINNLGDPFVESNYGVHSREFEKAVLNYFADLWVIPKDKYWGYVTTCGTEGNLHGILVAREVLPDGILYASEESHYSVFKAARFYRMEAVAIPTIYTGEIDYRSLEENLRKNKDKPAIINCNVGTTVKGAVDDVSRVISILKRVGYTRDRWYIHCDGALFALMLPFVEGHKFLGCPMPCGVVIHWKKNVEAVESSIEYLNSVDATIMGSRNGQAPLMMWYALNYKARDHFSEEVHLCINNSRFLLDLLKSNNISCLHNDLSNTVVFERPPCKDFIRRYQLACKGNIAHVVVMQNITKEKLTAFVDDLIAVREIAAAAGSLNACVRMDIGPCCICVECNK